MFKYKERIVVISNKLQMFLSVPSFLFFSFLFFVFLPFLGLLPRHMELPQLGVESEL